MRRVIRRARTIRTDAFYQRIGMIADACFAQGLDTYETTHLLRNEGHDISEGDVATALARWRDENVILEVIGGAELVA